MVPNGGRVYYSQRSQPPLLTLMAWEYYQKTGNLSVITEILPNLKREHQFWMTNRTVDVVDQTSGQTHQLVHYHALSDMPRPESYREDVTTAAGLQQGMMCVDINSSLSSMTCTFLHIAPLLWHAIAIWDLANCRYDQGRLICWQLGGWHCA